MKASWGKYVHGVTKLVKASGVFNCLAGTKVGHSLFFFIFLHSSADHI